MNINLAPANSLGQKKELQCRREYRSGAEARLYFTACPAGQFLYISDRADGLQICPVFRVLLDSILVVAVGAVGRWESLIFWDFQLSIALCATVQIFP